MLKTKKSFTLIELLVIVGILIVLTAIAVPTFRFFERESDLNNSAEEITNTLRSAQNKTLASEGASQWGVCFTTTTDPHQYTLFKGSDYNSRAISFDKIHKLPKSIEIYEIDLFGGGSEVVFERVTGITNQSGKVFLRLKANLSKTRTISIGRYGQIESE